MMEGVPVVAAAAGRVRAVREGEPDQPADGRLAIDYGDRNCGNGVVVEHDDGWSTQYCHLRQGSVTARTGGSVAAGQPLGLVGMSGETNFPHVHITVRRDDTVIDPYTGGADDVACGGEARPLWRPDLHEALRYRPVAIAAVGLAGEVPEHAEIVSGTVDDEPVRTDGSALVGYVLAYGLGRGDRVSLRITAPSGQPVAELTSVVEREAPRATRSGGKRTPAGGWPVGTYTVEATVQREEESFTARRQIELAQ